jgi:hypothetical protein
MFIVRENKKTKKQEYMATGDGGIKWVKSPWKADSGYSESYAKSCMGFELTQSAIAQKNRETYNYFAVDAAKELARWN